MANKWFGPKTYVSSLGLISLGDCNCCGCVCQSAVGNVSDTFLESESSYPAFENGARLKVIISGLPSSVFYSLTKPVNGFGEQWVYDITVTGLDSLNGTILATIPKSQYKCLWGGAPFSNNGEFYSESFAIGLEEVEKYCNGSFVQTTTTNVTVDATLTARVVRKNHADAGSVASNVFRYVSLILGFGTCSAGAPYYPYWPIFASDQYRLDQPIAGFTFNSASSGVGLDCKRLDDVASGVFAWRQSCLELGANDETSVATECGMSGGANVSDVTGAVGTYSIEIERL